MNLIPSRAKNAIKGLANQFGYEIHKVQPDHLDVTQEFHIKTIIDIGANVGQFAGRIRKLHPEARIFSFEPLPVPYRELSARFQSDPLFTSYNLGLGEQAGKAQLLRNGRSVFSSMLPMTSVCRESFPMAEDMNPESIEMTSLDEWSAQHSFDKPLMVKIDVQGYEDRVIRGGVQTIREASLVLTEVSYATLYQSQALFHDIYCMLHDLGFTLAGTLENVRYNRGSRIVQSDALFENRFAERHTVN